FPAGGTAMFALLAMAGDLGGSIGPSIVGRVADNYGGSINMGMRAGILFPVTMCVMLILFKKIKKEGRK
ncbi:MAG: MFS transporter, partial [Lachnospiraceae bacterium]|nr:MFS transporter [Lachnospiraceae bacterium]